MSDDQQTAATAVTAVAPGTAIVSATIDGHVGSASVTVTPVPVVQVSLEPTSPAMFVDESRQFNAVPRDSAGNPLARPLAWATSDRSVAEVDDAGVVSAVASGVAVITATSEQSSAASTVQVEAPLPSTGRSISTELRPFVLQPDADEGVAVYVDGLTGTSAIRMSPFFQGGTIDLRRLGATDRFYTHLSPEQALNVFKDTFNSPDFGRRHQSPLGSVTLAGSFGTRTAQLSAPVRTSAMPDRSILSHGPDIQSTDYVVNIRIDSMRADGSTSAIVSRFYSAFPDAFDFLLISEAMGTQGGFSYSAVRNATQGLGLSAFDFASAFGAAGTQRLRGIVNVGGIVDLAEMAVSHEIGHCCMVFLKNTALGQAAPHWPKSNTAFAVMGSNGNPGSNAGVYALTPLGNDDYRIDVQKPAAGFNMLELYLLGVADASEVDTQHVFVDQNQPQVAPGAHWRGTRTPVTIEQIIAANGPRIPAFPLAPASFTMATVIVSRGRLLTPHEMAYYDFQSRRGEAQVRFDDKYLAPFFVVTGGRGTLVTRLR